MFCQWSFSGYFIGRPRSIELSETGNFTETKVDFTVNLTDFMAMTLSSSPIEERDSDCMKDWKNWFK